MFMSMSKKELKIINITRAYRPNNEPIILIEFGFEVPEDLSDAKQTRIVPIKTKYLQEWKVRTWISEEDWNNLKNKYTFGDSFEFVLNSNGSFELKKIN